MTDGLFKVHRPLGACVEARADTVDLLPTVREVRLVVDFFVVVVVGALGVDVFRLPDLPLVEVQAFVDSTLLFPPLVFLAGWGVSPSASSSSPVGNDLGQAELPRPTAS